MNLFRRTCLGLDVRSDSLCAVSLRRQGRGVSVSGGRAHRLSPAILELSVREPNVADPKGFVAAVREALGPLAGSENRISLSLPDQVGRVLLYEVDTDFKTRAEGVEVLKWKLKNSLPAEPRNIQLDFQVLGKTDKGGYRLAVSFIVRSILHQYEELLAEAGFNASQVDFHSFNLYHYYRSRLESGGDFILVGVEDAFLCLQFFQGSLPVFHRTKTIVRDPAKVFQEINLSFAGYRENLPGFHRVPVFLHTDWEGEQGLLEALNAAFERQAVLLDPRLERIAVGGLSGGAGRSLKMVAAVGAAERLL